MRDATATNVQSSAMKSILEQLMPTCISVFLDSDHAFTKNPYITHMITVAQLTECTFYNVIIYIYIHIYIYIGTFEVCTAKTQKWICGRR